MGAFIKSLDYIDHSYFYLFFNFNIYKVYKSFKKDITSQSKQDIMKLIKDYRKIKIKVIEKMKTN